MPLGLGLMGEWTSLKAHEVLNSGQLEDLLVEPATRLVLVRMGQLTAPAVCLGLASARRVAVTVSPWMGLVLARTVCRMA